jgi:hypothetical protein
MILSRVFFHHYYFYHFKFQRRLLSIYNCIELYLKSDRNVHCNYLSLHQKHHIRN